MSYESDMRLLNRSLNNLGYPAQAAEFPEIQNMTKAFLRRFALDFSDGHDVDKEIWISAHDSQGRLLFHLNKESLEIVSDCEEGWHKRSKLLLHHLMRFQAVEEIDHFVVYEKEVKQYIAGDFEGCDDNHFTAMVKVDHSSPLSDMIQKEVEYVREAIDAISVST